MAFLAPLASTAGGAATAGGAGGAAAGTAAGAALPAAASSAGAAPAAAAGATGATGGGLNLSSLIGGDKTFLGQQAGRIGASEEQRRLESQLDPSRYQQGGNIDLMQLLMR